jgi:cyclopropane-fatty-acyl-phospholipid synthase
MTMGLQSERTSEDKARSLVEEMFSLADVRINGERGFDIRVTHDGFYRRVIRDGVLGIGESYADGWWECDQLDELTRRFVQANLRKEASSKPSFLLYALKVRLSGIGKKSRAFEVGQRHYDIGNELFQVMLDDRMIYSCAYWKNAATLAQAQENKLDLVCRKLGLTAGMRVLDIGCGWGGWARFAAQNYGVEVVGVTVSKEQLKYAQDCSAGLPIEFRLQDYRDVNEKFDRVVSIAMFEAVGHKYYREFMTVVDRCLKDDGLFLLHTILGNEPITAEEGSWLSAYIFPNGELPSLAQITRAAEGLFIVEATQHFGDDYERTLAAWHEKFVNNWPKIEHAYGQRFFRTWTLYLLMARGLFQSRLIHVWQFVFSKNGIPGRGQWPTKTYFEMCDAR